MITGGRVKLIRNLSAGILLYYNNSKWITCFCKSSNIAIIVVLIPSKEFPECWSGVRCCPWVTCPHGHILSNYFFKLHRKGYFSIVIRIQTQMSKTWRSILLHRDFCEPISSVRSWSFHYSMKLRNLDHLYWIQSIQLQLHFLYTSFLDISYYRNLINW